MRLGQAKIKMYELTFILQVQMELHRNVNCVSKTDKINAEKCKTLQFFSISSQIYKINNF